MLNRQHGEIIFQCDGGCSETLETGTRDFDEAKEHLDIEGWKARKIGSDWVHFCRGCKAVGQAINGASRS